MATAFTWLLALRYLTSRWVNVLCVLGVAVAVWALIVVPSVFAGFIADIYTEVRRTSPDLMLTGLPHDTGYEALRAALAADKDVVALAPRLRHYGVIYQRSSGIGRTFSTDVDFSSVGTNFVQVIGIDPQSEANVTPLNDWLERASKPPNKTSRLKAPILGPDLQVPGDMERQARRKHDLPVPAQGDWRSIWPGMLLSSSRCSRMFSLQTGYPIDLVAVAWTKGGGTGGSAGVTTLKKTFACAGAFSTGARLFDEVSALIAIEPLREMLGESALDGASIDLVTDIAIRCKQGLSDEQLGQLAARLCTRVLPILGNNSKAEVLTWRGQNRVILDAVDLERAMTTVVLLAVMLIAAFLIYATLHMMVTQKIKDIGILTALGGAPAAVGSVFTQCGFVIGLLGSLSGTALGILSVIELNPINDWMTRTFGVALFDHSLFDLPEIPYQLEPMWIIKVAVLALAMSLLVAWLPARKAARMNPVKALSYE